MNDDARGADGGGLSGAEEYFDADWYRSTYPDTADIDPWTHFVSFGDSERRSPGPAFDAEFYARTYLRLEEGDAMRHFLREGRAAGFLPLPRTRTADESQETMEALLAGVENPAVLIGNDAQEAGAPLLLLEFSRHLQSRGYSPVFLLLRGGPLRPAYAAIGPVIVLAEGDEASGIGRALPPGTPVLGNTGLSAPVLTALGHDGPQVLLVHEMPEFLSQHGLLEAVARCPRVVVSFPGMVHALAAMLPAETEVECIPPGLLHVSVGPQSTARVRGRIGTELGARRPLFIGAGYADQRKGFDRFLRIAASIHSRVPESGFIWLGELSSWARDLADQAISQGLPLMLPGFRRDAAAWYDCADVYLLTSRQDPGPTTAVDAARRGTPFVAAPGDIGLRALSGELLGVGLFCDSEDEVGDRAQELAERDTDATRQARRAVIEERASFVRYVDAVVEPWASAPPAVSETSNAGSPR
ncbi:glycosyltransferase [Leucobacter rhizosphaerae]|uniref:Glycosyltransferase n=1 Tax=Leucobacter rhizosphaerae TaxID=2932245 RepID=A0ABY4FUS7_9MICO|nr:glycosyltransferase [Leucobacter rhizosphaerae]UOQ60065.1 glycosyltransferase [Leucobacter rhizosphaerae]